MANFLNDDSRCARQRCVLHPFHSICCLGQEEFGFLSPLFVRHYGWTYLLMVYSRPPYIFGRRAGWISSKVYQNNSIRNFKTRENWLEFEAQISDRVRCSVPMWNMRVILGNTWDIAVTEVSEHKCLKVLLIRQHIKRCQVVGIGYGLNKDSLPFTNASKSYTVDINTDIQRYRSLGSKECESLC